MLTELDGTGVLLAYLLVERSESNEPTVSEKLAQILVKFLGKLCVLGGFPYFVDCDKDKSEKMKFKKSGHQQMFSFASGVLSMLLEQSLRTPQR